MDLQIVHNRLRFYIDKSKNDWYPPGELDNTLDDAQLELFTQLAPQYGATQKVHDSLLPFKEEYGFSNAASPGGLITLPANYQHLLAVETQILDGTTTLYLAAELLNESQISTRRSSQLIPLSVKTPVCLLKKGKKVQLYPAVPSAGTVYYLRKPAAPVFVYTPNGRQLVYNQNASTQLEWDDPSIEKIIYKTLSLLGINLKDGEAIQVGDAKDKSVA
jgi:hypothetical protein